MAHLDNDEMFLNNLVEKYGFERDENNKVKLDFDVLTIRELISVYNRYCGTEELIDCGNGEIEVNNDEQNFHHHIRYEVFRQYFKDEFKWEDG